MELAIFGGGCFWCMEPVFRALKGVLDVQPGYSGGHLASPTYEQVCRQDTGHIEVVQVSYDPDLIRYRTLLEVFFGTHDPTTPDRQGNDVGPQYASVIFYDGPEQCVLAETVRSEAQAALDAPICTRIQQAGVFWPAEGLHHKYFQHNPQQAYCQFVIAPKMREFRTRYAHLLA